MHIIKTLLITILFIPSLAKAMDMDEMTEGEQTIFHAFTLETDIGDSREGTLATWDFDGWVGGDINKLHLKSEGERVENETHQAEFWAMYSRNVTEFWDVQAGVRYDIKPEHTAYLTLGVEGMAKYFFETEAHLFVSDEGDVSARIRQERDFLITQKLILEPYVEIELYSQDVSDQEVGAGLANGEVGLQTRYEITRKFAPYIDLRYESKFGETANIARSAGETRDDARISVGLRLRFN